MSACVCGSGLEFSKCCEPILAGQPAPTAEALMRSRYAAYVVGNIDHIRRTCGPKAIVDFDQQDTERFIEETVWQGLEILETKDGGPNDTTGIVDFIFRCTQAGQALAQREIASFDRIDGAWLYQSSIVNPKPAPLRVEKISRNDPCPCGSTKKYKKCCGA